jgi:hypothetical protein
MVAQSDGWNLDEPISFFAYIELPVETRYIVSLRNHPMMDINMKWHQRNNKYKPQE